MSTAEYEVLHWRLTLREPPIREPIREPRDTPSCRTQNNSTRIKAYRSRIQKRVLINLLKTNQNRPKIKRLVLTLRVFYSTCTFYTREYGDQYKTYVKGYDDDEKCKTTPRNDRP